MRTTDNNLSSSLVYTHRRSGVLAFFGEGHSMSWMVFKPRKSNDKHEETVQGDDITVLDYFRAIYKYIKMRLLICGLAVVRPAIISLFLPKTCYLTALIAPPIEILQIEQSFGKRNSSLWEISNLSVKPGIK